MSVTFHKADLSGVETMLTWAEAEGWNPGHDDPVAFYATDPDGFFLARVEDVPVASISVVNHSDALAFLGLYICQPAYRGRGIGFGLWTHALRHAGDRVVGLDGVPDQQDNYRRSGFVRTGQTTRLEGDIPAGDPAPLRPAAAADLPQLQALDQAAQGYAKPAFLKAWLTPTAARQTYVLDQDGTITGFATIRRCGRGAKIGPLVASDIETARTLLQGMAALWPDRPLILDVPDTQTDLTAACQAWGMVPAFHTARMYRGAPPTPGTLIASAGTLELG